MTASQAKDQIKKGPQAARFNPDNDGPEKKFKGGAKLDKNETLCSKKRFQQIAITALGNLTSDNTTNASRILQSSSGSSSSQPVYTMTLTVGTTAFSDDSSFGSLSIIFSYGCLVFVMLLCHLI